MKAIVTTLTLSTAATAAVTGVLSAEHIHAVRVALPDAITIVSAALAGGVGCLAGVFPRRPLHIGGN